MNDDKLIKKLADVPLARPGFDALGLAAPVLCQANPQGKWESSKPSRLDEERLKAIIQHLVNSNKINNANSYCCQCALENKNAGMSSNYVPVIMMPIYPSDQCPFDMDCEIQKMKAMEAKPTKKSTKKAKDEEENSEDKDTVSKPKKRGFVMQRLTDFDLLSQW